MHSSALLSLRWSLFWFQQQKFHKSPGSTSWKITIFSICRFIGIKKTTFRPFIGLFNWFFDADFKFDKFFKNSLSLLYFLLTLYSTFAQLSSIVEQMCLLKILLYSTLRISVFTHTLGKIHFLLCFACLLFLWTMVVIKIQAKKKNGALTVFFWSPFFFQSA